MWDSLRVFSLCEKIVKAIYAIRFSGDVNIFLSLWEFDFFERDIRGFCEIIYMKIKKFFRWNVHLCLLNFNLHIATIILVCVCISFGCGQSYSWTCISSGGIPIEKGYQKMGVGGNERAEAWSVSGIEAGSVENENDADNNGKDIDLHLNILTKLISNDDINEFILEFEKFSDKYKSKKNEYANSCRKLLKYSKNWDMSEAILKSLSDIGDEPATRRILFYYYSIKDRVGVEKFGERLINIYLKQNRNRKAAAECIKISNLLRIEYRDAKTALEYLKKWEHIKDDTIPIAIANIYAKNFPEESEAMWEYYEKAAKMGSLFAKSKIARRDAAIKSEKEKLAIATEKKKIAHARRVVKKVEAPSEKPYEPDLTSVGELDKNFRHYPASNGVIYSMTKCSSGYVVAGFFSQYNGLNASNICVLRANGEVIKSEKDGLKADRAVYSVSASDNSVVIGGRFSKVNGNSSVGIAVLNSSSFNYNSRFKLDPGINEGKSVKNIKVRNGIIYFMGDFNYYNGKKHPGVYAVNFYGRAQGVISPYLNLDRSVNDICFTGNNTIIGGEFSFVKNERNRKKPDVKLHPLDACNRLWDTYCDGFSDADGIGIGSCNLEHITPLKIKGISPSSGSVNALLYRNGVLFVGGEFQSFNNGNDTTGLVALWEKTLTVYENVSIKLKGRVNALLEYHGNIIVGGSFTELNGVKTGNIAIIDGTGKVDENFAKAVGKGFNGEVYGLYEDCGYLFVVGDFSKYNGEKVGNIAKIKLP